MVTPALEAVDVAVARGGRTIVRSASLHVDHGTIVALIGPNGCGKSTLLSALSGIERPAGGRVLLDGVEMVEIPRRELARRRAIVLQQNDVSFGFTVHDVVAMGRHPWERRPERVESAAAIEEAIGLCELDGLREASMATLSGGERARVAVARALAQRTPVLMLDEPSAAMDLRHQEHLFSTLRQRAGQGAAILVVVHDLALAAAYADRIVLMDNGETVAAGTPREVLTADHIDRVYRHPIDTFDHPGTGQLIVLPHRSDVSATDAR